MTPSLPSFISPLPLRPCAPLPGALDRRTTLRACSATPTPEDVETTYRLAKAAYKQAKYAAKALRKQQKEQARTLQDCVDRVDGRPRAMGVLERQVEDANVIVLCGGKTCKRMGVDAVAEVLRRGKRGGEVRMDAPCMKMCGGVGPTVLVGGEERKIDFGKAVMDAVAGGS